MLFVDTYQSIPALSFKWFNVCHIGVLVLIHFRYNDSMYSYGDSYWGPLYKVRDQGRISFSKITIVIMNWWIGQSIHILFSVIVWWLILHCVLRSYIMYFSENQSIIRAENVLLKHQLHLAMLSMTVCHRYLIVLGNMSSQKTVLSLATRCILLVLLLRTWISC